MCSPKTMVKIGAVIAVPLGIGLIAFPEFRGTIAYLVPFALFAVCPLGMIFGMRGMMGDKKDGKTCPNCSHEHHSKEVIKN